MDKIIANERLLSDDLLARIFVLRHTREPDLSLFSSTLPISDEMVNITVLKTSLNALQELSSRDTNLKSLELSVASEDLDPNR